MATDNDNYEHAIHKQPRNGNEQKGPEAIQLICRLIGTECYNEEQIRTYKGR